VVVLTAGWHLGFRRLGINEERVWLVLVYLAGLLTLWFVLAGIHPAYFSLLLVMYPQIFRHLRLALAVPAAVALTVEVVWREVLASGQPLSENLPAIAGGLVSVVFGSLFARAWPATSTTPWPRASSASSSSSRRPRPTTTARDHRPARRAPDRTPPRRFDPRCAAAPGCPGHAAQEGKDPA
jgi:hypothetical protein